MNQKIALFAGLLAVRPRGRPRSRPWPRSGPAYPAGGSRPAALRGRRASCARPGSSRSRRPVRHGPAYVLQARQPGGQEVARRRRCPQRHASCAVRARSDRRAPRPSPDVPALPPPYARPPAADRGGADGYGPNSRTAGLEPDRSHAGARRYGPIAGPGALPPWRRRRARRSQRSTGRTRGTPIAAAAAQAGGGRAVPPRRARHPRVAPAAAGVDARRRPSPRLRRPRRRATGLRQSTNSVRALRRLDCAGNARK